MESKKIYENLWCNWFQLLPARIIALNTYKISMVAGAGFEPTTFGL